MTQAPVRLLFTLKPKIPAGVLAAVAVSTVVFAATPFLVKGVAIDQHVDVSTVAVISTAQLAGFMLTSWGAGRVLRPRRRVMVISLLLGLLANAASALTPWFSLLVGIRFISGISLGLISWIAWSEVFGDDERVGDVAVIGPIVGTLSAPLIAMLIDISGTDLLFFALAGLHLLPLPFIRETRLVAATRTRRERHRPTRAAAAILACLGVTTLGGSAVFVFAAVIGQDHIGLSALAVSFVFSANALAGVPSARYRGARRLPGLWMALTGVAAVFMTTVQEPIVFWLALPIWGFAFWMGIPGAYSLLAERSNYPEERAGDAQAIMAGGRVIGPLLGGALYAWSVPALGIVGGGLMALAGLTMVYVEWRIRPNVLGDLVGG
ncbi:MAG TPA: MFS transporter [Ilumatobacter sp.]|nr:MFS transporter [Ilumatobacter sp.]